MIDKDKLQHEVHELFKEYLDSNNVGKLKTEIVAWATRIDATAKEEAAKMCEQIGSELSPVGFGRKVVNECATAIRASKGEGVQGK